MEYAKLSSTPYCKSTYPGTLQIPATTSHHKAVRLYKEHSEKLLLYQETLNVKNILKSQTIQSIDYIFLYNHINKNTNRIVKSFNFFSILFKQI